MLSRELIRGGGCDRVDREGLAEKVTFQLRPERQIATI